MKKTLTILVLSLVLTSPAYAVSVSRPSSFSSYRPSVSSFRPSVSSYRPTTTYHSSSSSFNSSSTSSRAYNSSTSVSSSFYNPMNTAMLVYILTQNNRTQSEISQLKKIAEKKGYDSNGNWYYTKEGFDINGFTPNGDWWYDKDGYDVNGYNALGFDKKGNKLKK